MKKIIGLGIVVALLVVAYLGWSHYTASTASVANLQTATVQRGTVVAMVSAAGNVSAVQDESMAFQTTGRVAKVNVQSGDAVKKGQVLMQLDTTNLQLALQTAQANLLSAQANYKDAQAKNAQNPQQLIAAKAALDNAQAALQQAQAAYDRIGGASNPNIGMTSQALQLQQATNNYDSALATYKQTVATINDSALQVAQANLEQAQVAVKQAQNNLAQAQIFAPFDGVVGAVNYTVGQFANTSTPAVEVVNLKALQVEATVSEIDVPKLKVGQTAQLTFDALPNQTYTATVTNVSPVGTITQGVVNYPVTLTLTGTSGRASGASAEGAVMPGMTANVNIVVARVQNVLVIPTRAVHTLGRRETADVLENGKQVTVPIQTGLSDAQQVEVTSGLTAGEQVVVNPIAGASAPAGGPAFRGGGFGRFGG